MFHQAKCWNVQRIDFAAAFCAVVHEECEAAIIAIQDAVAQSSPGTPAASPAPNAQPPPPPWRQAVQTNAAAEPQARRIQPTLVAAEASTPKISGARTEPIAAVAAAAAPRQPPAAVAAVDNEEREALRRHRAAARAAAAQQSGRPTSPPARSAAVDSSQTDELPLFASARGPSAHAVVCTPPAGLVRLQQLPGEAPSTVGSTSPVRLPSAAFGPPSLSRRASRSAGLFGAILARGLAPTPASSLLLLCRLLVTTPSAQAGAGCSPAEPGSARSHHTNHGGSPPTRLGLAMASRSPRLQAGRVSVGLLSAEMHPHNLPAFAAAALDAAQRLLPSLPLPLLRALAASPSLGLHAPAAAAAAAAALDAGPAAARRGSPQRQPRDGPSTSATGPLLLLGLRVERSRVSRHVRALPCLSLSPCAQGRMSPGLPCRQN